MQVVPGQPRRKGRLARALGLDANPLRRASDRAETWIRVGLLVIFLTIGPMGALAAGQWTAHAAHTGTSAQPHAVRTVPRQPATTFAGPSRAATVRLNAPSQATNPPPGGDVAVAATITAVMTLTVTGLALLIVMRLIQCFLNWRRLTAWDAAWRATGPRWTGHRS